MKHTKEHRYLNVIDVEATCWKGVPPPKEVSEIIEIGLCVIDVKLQRRVTRQRILVRPARSKVSTFCTELTGLTQEFVDKGFSFRKACQVLIDYHHADTRPWASWGEYDRKQFERQCAAGGTPYPFSPHHDNAKRIFAAAHTLARGVGMRRALQMSGLQLDGRHHAGIDDAWNIGGLITLLMQQDLWPI